MASSSSPAFLSASQVVTFGDMEGEDRLHRTEHNFMQLLRLSQLASEYLLYVQDVLALENEALKVSKDSNWRGNASAA
jgi:Iguana/Dzip1-like DAZ-interacting protein N-terminal